MTERAHVANEYLEYSIPAAWGPFVQGVLNVCNGTDDGAEITDFLNALNTIESLRNLASTIRDILDGERNRAVLTQELELIDGQLVEVVLDTLARPESSSVVAAPASLPPAGRATQRAVAVDQDLLDRAEEYANRALEIVESLGPQTESWTVYSLLAQISEYQGRPDEARRWRRREQESFAAFAGADVEIREWLPLIPVIVAACEGSEEARKQAEQQLQAFAEGWPTTVATVRRVLQGERDLDSLTADLTSKGALIVRRILEALAGEPPPPAPPRPPSVPPKVGEEAGEGAQEGITLEQVFGLVEAGCRGDTQAGQLAYNLVTQGLQAGSNPPEIRALGKTLQRILEGLRGEEPLVGLPAELRPPVEELLRRVGQ